MKNLIRILCGCSLFLSLYSCSETCIERGTEEFDYVEKKRNIVYHRGEVFSGCLTKSHKNGQLEEKQYYDDGKKAGTWEEYYENGQLEDKFSYLNAKKEGERLEYYENGQIKCKQTYKEGNNIGSYEEFQENGKPKSKRNYNDEGKLDGASVYYDDEGNETKTTMYKDGVREK